MVAADREWTGQTMKNSLPVMLNRTAAAMHRLAGPDDGTSQCLGDDLVSQADAQHGQLAGELPDKLQRDARLVGSAGTRGEHHRVE